jgi:hypothetical protein
MQLARILVIVSLLPAFCLAGTDAPLPANVKAVWDLEHAAREMTATRERVCLKPEE